MKNGSINALKKGGHYKRGEVVSSGGIQLENNYTRIANKTLEKLAMTNLNGTQRRILDVVLRQTYGYQRKEHGLSINFISKATNIHKMQIQRELTSLFERRIVNVVQEATFNKSRVIALNENLSDWIDNIQLAKKLTVNKSDNHTVSGKANTTVSGKANQIKKKENIKEKYSSLFEIFYKIYPRATEKKRTLTNWSKCIKEYSPEEIIKAAENYKAKVEVEKTEKQYIKTSANFLGRDKFFEDYLNVEQPEEIKPNPEYIRMKELLNGGSGTGL